MSNQPSPAQLGTLKRHELQKLAMANDIKANQKSSTLIELLLAKHAEDESTFVFTDTLTALLGLTSGAASAHTPKDGEVNDENEGNQVLPTELGGNADVDTPTTEEKKAPTTRGGRKRKAPEPQAEVPNVDGAGRKRRFRSRRGEPSQTAVANDNDDEGVNEAGPSEPKPIARAARGGKGARGRGRKAASTKAGEEKEVIATSEATVKSKVIATGVKHEIESDLSSLPSEVEQIPTAVRDNNGKGKVRDTRPGSGIVETLRVGATAVVPGSQNALEEAEVIAQIQAAGTPSPISGTRTQLGPGAHRPENPTPMRADTVRAEEGHVAAGATGQPVFRSRLSKSPSSYGFTTPTHTPPSSPLQLPSNLQSPRSSRYEEPVFASRRNGPASPEAIKATLALLSSVQERDEELRDEIVSLREIAKEVEKQAIVLQERLSAEKFMGERIEGAVRYWRGGGYYNVNGVEDDYEDGITGKKGEAKKKWGKKKAKKEWRPAKHWSHQAIWGGKMRVLRALDPLNQQEVTTSDEEGPYGLLYRIGQGEDVNIGLQRAHGEEGVLDTLGVGQAVPEEYWEVVKQQQEEQDRKEAEEAAERERVRKEREAEERERDERRREEDEMVERKREGQRRGKKRKAEDGSEAAAGKKAKKIFSVA